MPSNSSRDPDANLKIVVRGIREPGNMCGSAVDRIARSGARIDR